MKRLISIGLTGLLFGTGLLFVAGPASANFVATLNVSNCCGTGPFGTVTVTDIAAGVIDVDVALTNPPASGFINSGLTSFLFNSSTALTSASVSQLTTGWSWASSLNGDGAGTFGYGFDCGVGLTPACGNGGSSPTPGPLHFRLTAAGLTDASFTANANGATFAADICYQTSITATGCAATGMVWTTTGGGPPNQTPEPQTLALIGLGLLGLAVMRRRRTI